MPFCPLYSDNEGIVLTHGSLPPRKERTERAQHQCPRVAECSSDQCFLTLGHLAMPDINAYHNIHSVLFSSQTHSCLTEREGRGNKWWKVRLGWKEMGKMGKKKKKKGIIKRKDVKMLPVSYVLPSSRGGRIQGPSWDIVSKSCWYCLRPPEKFSNAFF